MSNKESIETFLKNNGCKATYEKNGLKWFANPEGKRFAVSRSESCRLEIVYKAPDGETREFIEDLNLENVDIIAKGFILWMLEEG